MSTPAKFAWPCGLSRTCDGDEGGRAVPAVVAGLVAELVGADVAAGRHVGDGAVGVGGGGAVAGATVTLVSAATIAPWSLPRTWMVTGCCLTT